jgi:hypothetical protein
MNLAIDQSYTQKYFSPKFLCPLTPLQTATVCLRKAATHPGRCEISHLQISSSGSAECTENPFVRQQHISCSLVEKEAERIAILC